MGLNKKDIVTINLNPKKGHEVGKIRPCVVLSDSDENRILDTIIVMPLSTSLLDNMRPYRMRIAKRDKLQSDSDILINQVRSISKARVGEKIAALNDEEFLLLKTYLCENI